MTSTRERIERIAEKQMNQLKMDTPMSHPHEIHAAIIAALTALCEEMEREKETKEILIYDAMRLIQDNSETLAMLANLHRDDPASVEAYKGGVYQPCIKLQVALGPEAMERGKQRHEDIKRKAAEHFAPTHFQPLPSPPNLTNET